MHFPQEALSLLVLLGSLITSTQAASCSQSGGCIVSNGATRDNMYAARQEVCGTNRYQVGGTYGIPGKDAYLRWGGGGSQQTCWNAFQNIIDQCSLGVSGYHTHAGQYDYNGVYYNAVDCDE